MEDENLAVDAALTNVLKETVSQLNAALPTNSTTPLKWFPKGVEIIRIKLTVSGVVGELTIAGPDHPVSLADEAASEAKFEE